MTASPVGAVIGAIVVGRLVSPATRQRLLRPLAVLVPAALVPVFRTHSVGVIGTLSLISSFAVAGLTAPANGPVVQALPAEFRARAFGVMQAGLALFQGAGLLAAGYIASHVEVSTAVTIFSSIGVCVMIGISVVWPSPDRVDETIASVRAHNAVTIAAVDGRRPRHAAPEGPAPAATSPMAADTGDRSANSPSTRSNNSNTSSTSNTSTARNAPTGANVPMDVPAQTAAPSQPTTPKPGTRSSIGGYSSGQTSLPRAMPPAETPWTG